VIGQRSPAGRDTSGTRQGDDEIEGLANAFIAVAESRQVIRAEIVGTDQCHAEGIGVRGGAPVLAICRKLTAAGFDPGRPLHAFRGNVLCLVIRSVGEAARFVVDERRMALARWKPLSCAEVPPPVAPRGVAAAPLQAAE
jgi:hypothetical protein